MAKSNITSQNGSSMKYFLILIVTIILGACGPRTPQSELNETITEMLALIDHGKSQELLAKYADFSDARGSIIDIPEDKLKSLKFHLLRTKEMQPRLTESNTLAVYEDSSFERPLRFKKVGQKWLLKDK